MDNHLTKLRRTSNDVKLQSHERHFGNLTKNCLYLYELLKSNTFKYKCFYLVIMLPEENYEKGVLKRLNAIISLLMEIRDREGEKPLREKISLLARSGFSYKEIAEIIGKTRVCSSRA